MFLMNKKATKKIFTFNRLTNSKVTRSQEVMEDVERKETQKSRCQSQQSIHRLFFKKNSLQRTGKQRLLWKLILLQNSGKLISSISFQVAKFHLDNCFSPPPHLGMAGGNLRTDQDFVVDIGRSKYSTSLRHIALFS